MKRLCIVVPYREREAHLKKFVPHLRAYFARDKIDHKIPYSALIIEQEGGLPFNRGALKNIGFRLGCEDSDYSCFHDVDYLPVWADYSWTDVPSPIVWWGAEMAPIAPKRSDEVVLHNLDLIFGGVLLIPNDLFSQVDGYSNDYWGWGYEDMDLASRFKAARVTTIRRKGTFIPLPHDNEGFQVGGKPSPIAQVNRQLYEKKWTNGAANRDGISNLTFEILNRRKVPDDSTGERSGPWEVVTVRLTVQPRQDQLDALKRGLPA